MYVLASLPFVYVFSFIPKSGVMAFTNFFILNVVLCVIDAVAASFTVFSPDSTSGSGPSQTYTIVTNIRLIFAILLPTVNLKHGLANILIHDSAECIVISNRLLGTNLLLDEAWMSMNRPGVGAEFILFCAQILFWWVILIIIENRSTIGRVCGRCRRSNNAESTDHWNDSVCFLLYFTLHGTRNLCYSI